MKYASTIMKGGLETVAVVLDLGQVPGFDPADPPQANTYGVPDEVGVGWIRAGGQWLPPTPREQVLPALVLTALGAIDAGDAAATVDGVSEATIPVGAGVAAEFEVRLPGGQVAPVDMPFTRLPISTTDGRTAYAIIAIAQGRGSATWHPEFSGRWQITEANINSELPPEAYMLFSGLDVFVYDR